MDDYFLLLLYIYSSKMSKMRETFFDILKTVREPLFSMGMFSNVKKISIVCPVYLHSACDSY